MKGDPRTSRRAESPREVASLLYTEFKNTIARVAQIKELMGERDWRVTPRTPESETVSR